MKVERALRLVRQDIDDDDDFDPDDSGPTTAIRATTPPTSLTQIISTGQKTTGSMTARTA